jgi:hypothetical protein
MQPFAPASCASAGLTGTTSPPPRLLLQVLADWVSLLQPGGVTAVCYWPGEAESSAGPWHTYGQLLQEELGRAGVPAGEGLGVMGVGGLQACSRPCWLLLPTVHCALLRF